MPAGTPVSFSFRDSKNQTSVLRGFLPGDIAAADYPVSIESMRAAIAGLSNATVTSNQTQVSTAPVQGSTADYSGVEDKAVFVFQTAAGQVHRYQVAAPKAAIFLADDETVDYTNALVIAFVAQVNAAFVSRDGVDITASVGGYRRRAPLQRKFNIRTRNPLTTGQGL